MSNYLGGDTAISRQKTSTFAKLIERAGRSLLPVDVAGSLTIIFPNGQRTHLGQANAHPHAVLKLNSYKVIRRAIQRASIGFAESYIAGEIDTPDPVALIRFFIENRIRMMASSKVRALFKVRASDKFWHRTRRNSPARSKDNIEAHYDLGNDFYKAWLDKSMTYSSALFAEQTQSLHEAQAKKYQTVYDALGIQGSGKILEIGCGWGGFAEHVAANSKAHVTGITLSKEQLVFARNRIGRERAKFQLLDYRLTQGQYDAIASIEMIEAVGQEHWAEYFNILHDRLKPGASAVIQAITIADSQFESYRHNVDFIQRYIFPGGMLPSKTVLTSQAAQVGLEFETCIEFGADYARTLAIWRNQFNANWHEISALGFDERFYRMWNYYLAYCEAGFAAGVIDVGIYKLTRPMENA